MRILFAITGLIALALLTLSQFHPDGWGQALPIPLAIGLAVGCACAFFFTKDFLTLRNATLCAIIGAACAAEAAYFGWSPDPYDKYSAKLQVPLFAGYLTLAGFILSLKTNILLRLQKDLFADPAYEERCRRATSLNGKSVGRYASLINLGELLVRTVLVCLLASVSQVTLGFWRSSVSVVFCIGIAGAAFVHVLFCWISIRETLRNWFGMLTEQSSEKPVAKDNTAEQSK